MKMKLKDKDIEIHLCKSFKDKLLGLMFKKEITYGVRLKCKSIHTFFMKDNIDVIITDKSNIVLKIISNLPKNRIIIFPKAYYFYELPKSINTYKKGDTIIIK